MSDSYVIKSGDTTNHVSFNSVPGTLIKSTDKSKIVRFHMNSTLAKCFFDDDNPNRGRADMYPRETIKIKVLQVMLCGGDNYLVEYLDVVENKND